MSENENENSRQNEEEEKNEEDKEIKVDENTNEQNQHQQDINPENEQIPEQNNENNIDNNNNSKNEIDVNNEESLNQPNIEENLDNNNINNGVNEEEKKLKTKEVYELEINNLKQELEEKNRLLISLQNTDNPEYKIPELLGKIEAQNLFEIVNENKIKQQRLKIDSIKQMVKSLNEQFKNQLKMKEQKINKKLEPFVKKNKDLLQEVNSCKNQMNQLKERLEKGNNNLIQLQKEKSDLEESIIKREEKLNILFDRLNIFEDLNKKKTKLLKENEIYSKELIKIIEEQKEEIRELEKNSGVNKYISYNNKKSKDNERYNKNNNDITNDINNDNNNIKNENDIVLPNIYNNTEDKNKLNIENETVDYEFNKKEEENNNNKFNEFKNLMDDLYNNVNN